MRDGITFLMGSAEADRALAHDLFAVGLLAVGALLVGMLIRAFRAKM